MTDTSAEKAQDMAEVAAGLMGAYEYRMRWYSEDEATARFSTIGLVIVPRYRRSSRCGYES